MWKRGKISYVSVEGRSGGYVRLGPGAGCASGSAAAKEASAGQTPGVAAPLRRSETGAIGDGNRNLGAAFNRLERGGALEHQHFEAVGLDFILKQMELDREGKTNIVFLDACRDNPFTAGQAVGGWLLAAGFVAVAAAATAGSEHPVASLTGGATPMGELDHRSHRVFQLLGDLEHVLHPDHRRGEHGERGNAVR